MTENLEKGHKNTTGDIDKQVGCQRQNAFKNNYQLNSNHSDDGPIAVNFRHNKSLMTAESALSNESVNTVLKFNEISICPPPSNQHSSH